MEYSDEQLIELVREGNEFAKDELYNRYKGLIDFKISKYYNMAVMLGYEYKDLKQEALVGFADALNNYRPDKDANLSTFISLCVDRRLFVEIKKASTMKYKTINDSLSLEYEYEASTSLRDIISDNKKNDPLENIVKEEKLNELVEKIKNELSANEYEVYLLMISGMDYNAIAELLGKTPKQIDNAIQRIKLKIKKIVKK